MPIFNKIRFSVFLRDKFDNASFLRHGQLPTKILSIVDRVQKVYRDIVPESSVGNNSKIRQGNHQGPGEGKRRKELAEWYVKWRAEWHNYAKYDLRGE